MSGFTETALCLMPLPEYKRVSKLPLERGDKKRWVVTQTVTFEVDFKGSGVTVTPPLGLQTDLASVPKPALPIFNRFGLWTVAAVIHDFLYAGHTVMNGSEIPVTRKECDQIFLDAMLVSGVKKSRACVMYAAVRTFGSYAYWNSHRRGMTVLPLRVAEAA